MIAHDRVLNAAIWMLLAVLSTVCLAWTTLAQPAAPSGGAAPALTTVTNPLANVSAAARRSGTVRPPQPVESTPVDYFRQLLAAKGEERDRLLTSRPAAQHARFRAIIQDYERFPPEEQERRLQALELRYRISALLRLAPEGRAQGVARLAEAVRPIVQERLAYWDRLAPDVQRVLLENERLLGVITVVPRIAKRPPILVATALNSNQLGRVEMAVRDWNKLPEGKRAAAEQAFRQVFESGNARLTEGAAWSQDDQAEMQRALARFKHLSPLRRNLCIRNVPKLAEMTAAERAEFLQSAEEWRRMTSDDRQAWKNLVKRSPVFPPLPPGLRTLPPLPFRMPMIIPTIQTANDTNATER